jgi:hypothetical protein
MTAQQPETGRPIYLSDDLIRWIEQVAARRQIGFREALAETIGLGLRVSEEQARGSQILIRTRDGRLSELVTAR